MRNPKLKQVQELGNGATVDVLVRKLEAKYIYHQKKWKIVLLDASLQDECLQAFKSYGEVGMLLYFVA